MFAIRMKELREKHGYMSQQSFADAFGVAQSTVGNWEAGKRMPDVNTLIRLAAFFQTSVDYLLGVEGKPLPTPDPVPMEKMDELDHQLFSEISDCSEKQKRALIAMVQSMKP